MTALFAPRIRAARAAGRTRRDRRLRTGARRPARPAPAGRRSPRMAPAGKTLTLRYYVETVGVRLPARRRHRRRSSRRRLPPSATSSRSPSSATRARTRATPRSRARRAYTVCHFKSAKGAPTCEGVLAIGGNQLLIFRTEPGGDPVDHRRHGPLHGRDGRGQDDGGPEHEQLRRRGHGESQEVTPPGAFGSSPGPAGLLPVLVAVCDAPRMEDYRDVNRANWDDRVRGARRLAGLRRRALHRRPVVPERGRALRPARGSATSRASTACTCSATSAPTRSRSRGSARSMTGLDFSAPALEQGRRLAEAVGAEVDSSSPTSTARSTRSAASASTSSTPASARSAGCPTSAAGPRSSRACCGPAGGSSSARATRCCGRSTDPRAGRPAGRRVPVLRAARSRWSGTRAAPTSRPTRVHAQRDARVEPRPRRDRHPPCSTAGLELTALEEHDSVPWDALPGPDDARSAAASTASPTGPSACRTPTRCRRGGRASAL